MAFHPFVRDSVTCIVSVHFYQTRVHRCIRQSASLVRQPRRPRVVTPCRTARRIFTRVSQIDTAAGPTKTIGASSTRQTLTMPSIKINVKSKLQLVKRIRERTNKVQVSINIACELMLFHILTSIYRYISRPRRSRRELFIYYVVLYNITYHYIDLLMPKVMSITYGSCVCNQSTNAPLFRGPCNYTY